MEAEAVVEARGLEKAYGETVALSGASLSVERGEVFGLIGPNGAGKTTLVRALTGTTDPDAGTASILGESPTAVERDRLGVLPQDFSPPDRLTARELLEYYAGLYDDPRDPADVLADVGVVDSADTWYENLSGGQQRRVCVGSTLVNDPDVLFLDEPTTGIDPAGRRTVWRLIEDLAAAGTTVLLTTHDMAEAERLADRVGLLADGALVASGTPGALVAEYGGASRLTIETDAPLEALADLEFPVEAVELGRRQRSVADASDTQDSEGGASDGSTDRGATGKSTASPEASGTGAIVVRGVTPGEIATVVDFLEAEGIEYTGLSWSEPDLEDVYLSLADETERDRTRQVGEPDTAQAGETA
ncbi:ABC transporter ATP-binding protein [Natrarchaeobaculum aegyptiacum]|uniref:ABC transporter ATP-binding protein n=1 Tax=Natrarchaeobaculum aegyptiacum TaxID=745377 RepID=A0A2Z2HQT9_9EURY|nr:ABC transporter ATP-binding protein [Natrarchaeobaculum aegyptiacum]ARS88375.1 ABC transporter ATP-binding protein [Natrarchaeobaculum aegyptiacum]